MFVRVTIPCFLLVNVLFSGSDIRAALTRIQRFTGGLQESFEGFSNFNSTVDDLGHRYFLSGTTPLFEGQATITHPLVGIFEPTSADYSLGTSGKSQITDGRKGLGLGSTGPQVLPEFVEPASITFVTPLSSFGGYWGAGTDYLFDPQVIEFQFFNTLGVSIGSDEVPYSRSFLIDEGKMIYSGDGELQWMGWQFDVPVQRIVFRGGFVVADFLQADVIPEPATIVLLIGLIPLATGRRFARR
jgi:hypothetical protein